MNIHFKRNFSPDGTPETYEQTFNRLLAEETIVKHGLKPDAKVFDELIFDVNTEYFETHGGYEYAKSFFEEAYKLAVSEIGDERFVLSAVMHADEKNKALSESLGRDIYHYHLHVVYVPVVEKELYFKKNNKNPELAGKLKGVINQISHSKKWPMKLPIEKNGKTILVNSYSLLQDRFFEHMKSAGFVGFERGERGSTAEHLSDLEYKTQKESERLMDTISKTEHQERALTVLDAKAETKQKRLDKLDEKIEVKTKAAATIDDIEAIGKPGLLVGFSLTADEMKKLKALAKKSVTADEKVATANRNLKAVSSELAETKTQLAAEIKKRPSITDNLHWFDKFMAALRRAPKRLTSVIEEIMRQPPEKVASEPERNEPKKKSVREAL